VLYLGTSPSEPLVSDLLDRRSIGLMCQPASNRPRVGWLWAADTGCFSGSWSEDRWLAWLRSDHPRTGCLFATVPDVVGDAAATLDRWQRHAWQVHDAGYPAAYVLQDGADALPWDEFDCLFVGGTTSYKMSDSARQFAREARARNKWVHVGRVNSWSRFDAWRNDADSCDGTFLAFGPARNAARLVRWLDRASLEPQICFGGDADQAMYRAKATR
jgi:hypothetical protein